MRIQVYSHAYKANPVKLIIAGKRKPISRHAKASAQLHLCRLVQCIENEHLIDGRYSKGYILYATANAGMAA